MKTVTQAEAARRLKLSTPAIIKMLDRGALTAGPPRVRTVVLDGKFRNELNRRRTGR